MPTPEATGKWLFFSFAAALFGCLAMKADALGHVLASLIILPWGAGPAGLTAALAMKSDGGWTSWAFVAVEIAVVGSTAVLWFNMFMYPDAQNGIAMVFFPVLQFAGVLVAALVIKVASMTGRRS